MVFGTKLYVSTMSEPSGLANSGDVFSLFWHPLAPWFCLHSFRFTSTLPAAATQACGAQHVHIYIYLHVGVYVYIHTYMHMYVRRMSIFFKSYIYIYICMQTYV